MEIDSYEVVVRARGWVATAVVAPKPLCSG